MARVFLSVLIDTYNHERYVEDAISSVLAQDFPTADREVLVVDDGSTDRTPEIVAKFAPAVRLLRKPNGGQASAFNFAFPQCRGEIVSMLDGDDWWAQGKLTAVANAFAAHPNVGIVGHGTVEVFLDGSRRTEVIRDSRQFRVDSLEGARLFRLRKSFLGTSRMSCKADLLKRIGPAPEPLIVEADEYIFTLAAYFSEVLVLPEPFLFYRIHGQNMFQIGTGNLAPARRKHAILVALADSLQHRLADEHAPSDLSNAILESIQTEADVLALSLGGGNPLTTIRTEIRNYRIMHENASPLRWLFKYLSLFPALFVSPAQYVSLQRKLGANKLYRRARQALFPFYRPSHVDYTDEKSAQ
jgi:glycosyltransferase involved in cell wall biosynthesis